MEGGKEEVREEDRRPSSTSLAWVFLSVIRKQWENLKTNVYTVLGTIPARLVVTCVSLSSSFGFITGTLRGQLTIEPDSMGG